MSKEYARVIFDALGLIEPELPKETTRLVSALRDLSGEYPKELSVLSRVVDDRFMSICCHTKGQEPSDMARTIENASGYLQSEYMMDSGWSAYISRQFIAALWAYDNDRSIDEAMDNIRSLDEAERGTELIDPDSDRHTISHIDHADEAPAGIIVPDAGQMMGAGAYGAAGEAGYAHSRAGSFMTKQRKPLFIAAIALISVAFALGSFFVVNRLLDGPDKDAGGDVAETTAETNAPEGAQGEEGSGEEDGAAASGEPKAEDRVFAHRGTGGSENTFASFDSAISQGAKYVEQDVVLLDDGQFYVSHDRGLTLATAQAQGNPKLKDVFSKYGNKIVYVVELKTWTASAARLLVSLMREYGVEGNVIVQCFDQDVLRAVKGENPDITTMCLCDNNGRDGSALIQQGCGSGSVDMICVAADQGLMTSGNLQQARSSGKKFGAWCMDSEDQIRQAIDMGLDFYFTREPGMAIRLEKEYR